MSWYDWITGGGPEQPVAHPKRLERAGPSAVKSRNEGNAELHRAAGRTPVRAGDPFMEPRERVLVRVYDLGTTILTHPHNAISRSYGAFHTGVEVFGREWSFGLSEDWRTGITWCPPGKNPDHTFRETLAMGHTKCTFAEFTQILNEMKQDWRGSSYSLLTRNCHHFSDELCRRLDVGCLPPWINDLAGVGDATAGAIDKVYNSLSISDAFYTVKSGLYFTIAGVPECWRGRRRPELQAGDMPPQEDDEDSDDPDGGRRAYESQLREMPPTRGDLVYPAQGEAVLMFGKMDSGRGGYGTSSRGPGFPAPRQDRPHSADHM